ncbi:hypothetical protein ACWGIV_26405 [Streptomyces sp. NPDC054844]
MMNDFDRRAAKIFGREGGDVAWPYDLHSPQRHLKRTDPEWYEREVARQPDAQRVIVEWAEWYGLKATATACCPGWLTRKVSRRCSIDRCTKFGGGATDYRWLEHRTGWLLDGHPVALTSAPYRISNEEHARFEWWVAEDPRLAVALGGQGWYGLGSTQVLMWRTDVIEVMEPSPESVRALGYQQY